MPREEMYSVFNNGIGFVLVVEPSEAEDIAAFLGAVVEGVQIIGEIVSKAPDGQAVEWFSESVSSEE